MRLQPTLPIALLVLQPSELSSLYLPLNFSFVLLLERQALLQLADLLLLLGEQQLLLRPRREAACEARLRAVHGPQRRLQVLALGCTTSGAYCVWSLSTC